MKAKKTKKTVAKKKKVVKKKLVAKKKKKVVKKPTVTTAIVVREIQLSERQNNVIFAQTPPMFIKERKARGGKIAKYIEGGYVISQLNSAFSPFGWDFEVIKEEVVKRGEKEEVWVKGKLTIKDHKNGYEISKTQFGQHAAHVEVPLGDSLKAASTDAMKKCASLLGIGLDVYWKQLDEEVQKKEPKNTDKLSKAEKFELAKKMIEAARNTGVLFQVLNNIKDSTLYSEEQKKELERIISRQIDILDNK